MAEATPPEATPSFDGDISLLTPEMFEGFLKNPIGSSEIEKYEKQYLKEMGDEKLTHNSHFMYAVCLIRSRYNSDIRRGILLMEDLSLGDPKRNRDYVFFLSLGYARIKQYSVALRFVGFFLEAEPDNERIKLWRYFLEAKMKIEATIGAALATGSVLVIGGLLGVGLSLLRR